MTELLFTISDIITTPEGVAICGTSPKLDSLQDAEIAALINGLIVVDLPAERSTQRVLKVQSTISLIGKKNVFLLLSCKDKNIDLTWRGRSVYLKGGAEPTASGR